MAHPVAIQAIVALSRPEERLVVVNKDGPRTDWPEWVSLDVQVQFELDDGTRVSTERAKWQSGGPLNRSRDQLDHDIRDLVFSQPRYLPGEPADPALIVEELQHHGVDSNIETLAALPFSVILGDEVEAERAGQFQRSRQTD